MFIPSVFLTRPEKFLKLSAMQKSLLPNTLGEVGKS